METHQVLTTILVLTFTLVAAVCDWRTRRIPNWLTVSVLFVALFVHVVCSGFSGLRFALGGFATGFGILFILWIVGGGGGGDVKLMGALGACLGPSLTVVVFLLSAVLIVFLAGGALVIAFLTRGFRYVQKRCQVGRWSSPGNVLDADEKWRADRQRFRVLPYAVPVALSSWLVLGVIWTAASFSV